MRWRSLSLLVMLAFLPACATATHSGPDISSSGDYPAGYADGCASAGARDAQIPERPRYNRELARESDGYRAGWKAGYGVCGGDLPDDPLHHQ